MPQRRDQRGDAGPGDLHADAGEDEGGQPHHHVDAGLAEKARQRPGEAVRQIDRQRDREQAEHGGGGDHDRLRQRFAFRAAAADGQRHRDRSRSDGERQSERIETVADRGRGQFGFDRLPLRRRTAFAEQLPAHRRDEKPAGDAHHRHGEPEEFEDFRTEEERAEQEKKAVDRDAARKAIALGLGAARGQAQKNRRRAERIDDGKQRGEDEDERADGFGHGRRPPAITSIEFGELPQFRSFELSLGWYDFMNVLSSPETRKS